MTKETLFRIMKYVLLALVTFFLLSACGQVVPSITTSINGEKLTATKSNTASTLVASQTPYSSETSNPTATEWIKTYPTKKALVIYGTSSRNEYTINFIEWGDFFLQPFLILYEDGQLIFGIGGSEKQLSKTETEEILTTLEQLGFFQIQDNSAADMLKGMQNPIYILPTEGVPGPRSDLPWIKLTVNGAQSNSISYRREWENYLIQPIKDIIAYLDSISSEGATPYQPDRLLVSAGDAIRIPEPEEIIPWPQDVTSPLHRSYYGVFYLEGDEALKLYKAAGEYLFGYFSYEGKVYEVYLRPILPHECHIYHLEEYKVFSEQAQPYFTCDNW
jgi:hypothetical protein